MIKLYNILQKRTRGLKRERFMSKKILYEEWFLDISSLFIIHLPMIQYDEEAECFKVDATVDGSRYMKEIVGEIQVIEKTKEVLNEKMYEIIFSKMKNHFKVSDKTINKDRVFVNCLERLFEQMLRNSVLQETYSILLGNVLDPTLRERENIIKNLEALRLYKQLITLQKYWDLPSGSNSNNHDEVQVNESVNEPSQEIENKVSSKLLEDEETRAIAIQLVQRLECIGKENELKSLVDPERHPIIDLYNIESGHYQMVRLGENKKVEIPIGQYKEYVRYREQLDLYIIEELFYHPKIIFIDNVNEKLRSGKLEYSSMKQQLSIKGNVEYKIY